MASSHTAVLLMAYGSPDRLQDVEPYFTDIRGGRTPSRDAVEELTARYRRVGVPTPLLSNGRLGWVKLEPPAYRAALETSGGTDTVFAVAEAA